MIKRRLHLQIYATIIASLLAVVLVVSILFATIRGDAFDFDEQILGITGRLAWMALPPVGTPKQEQQQAINKLGAEFEIDLNLFDTDRSHIATYGEAVEPPDADEDESGWQRHGHGPAWILRLPDERWLSVNMRRDKKRRPIIGILIVLAGIAFAIGLASYPFVRKLTGRLERLQSGVELIGDGDLSARVEVEGKDEIASLAASFNSSAEKIERLVHSNKQLLANASHELRTPLARVRLGVEMLKEKPDAKRQAALESDIAELDQLIDEILLMSRLDLNAKPPMNEAIDLLALAAEEANRYDDCHVTGDLCEVQGNSKLLLRALRNLIDNAFKHGAAPVHIETRTGPSDVVLTVRDHGSGIAADQSERVFQPFYRAPGLQNVEGYGLGLALVKQIIEAHDGHVEVSSTGDDGTTIKVALPRLN